MKRTSPMSIAEIVDKVIKSNNLEEDALTPGHDCMERSGRPRDQPPHSRTQGIPRRAICAYQFRPGAAGTLHAAHLLLDALNKALGRQVLNDIKFM